MSRRRSQTSAAVLLTMIMSLALSAGAWAQDEEEGQGGGTCPSGQVRNAESGECERDRDCPEFDTQEEAQQFFLSRGGPDEDPHDLDDDSPAPDDGQACEDLPSEGDSGSSGGDSDNGDTPSGGVDSGYGPVAPTRETGAPVPPTLVGAGLAVLAILALGVARSRRTSSTPRADLFDRF